MVENIEKELASDEAQAQLLSRRAALKALAAASGSLAAAFLPGAWAKPVVEAGVLPAHAQSSCSLVIDTLTIDPISGASSFQVAFSYTDANGHVSDSARLFASTSDCGALAFNGRELPKVPATRTGNGASGKISFNFADSCSANPLAAFLTVQLAAGGCFSNVLSRQIENPYPYPQPE